MDIAAGHDAAALVAVPAEFELPAIEAIRPAAFLAFLVIDLDIAAQP
jgi:hypothetical protein